MADGVKTRRRFGGGAFLLGMTAAVGFYAVLSLPVFETSSLKRYCCSHDVEKLTVFMFAWGIADLALRGRTFRRQRRALLREWLPTTRGPQPIAKADEWTAQVAAAPASLQRTWIAQRVNDGLEYVREKQSAEGLEEHLRYLADTAADRSHAGFALVRIIAWMIPILGFLGTVVGITIAVANVSPDQLDSSLTQVTGGLAMAFDATAVALALAMGLMFAYFLVERSENAILHRVEDQTNLMLRHRFVASDSRSAPYLEPIRSASQAVVAHTETLVHRQAEVWTQALTVLMTQAQELHRRQEEAFGRSLQLLRSEGEKQHNAIMLSAEQFERAERRMAETAVLLGEIVQGGARLLPLQQSLVENLNVLRQTQGLDEALHSLTAAIHLMTVRNRPGAYGERAA